MISSLYRIGVVEGAIIMQDRPFPSDTQQQALLKDIVNHIRDMTVGFLKVSQHEGQEDVDPAGTGTLVEIDGIRGVLTASHVLDELPDNDKVGLVRFRNKPDDFQKTTIDMSMSQKIVIGGGPFGPHGPDIGFLRLPDDLSSALAATNVFFNGPMREEEMLSNPASRPYLDALVGVLAEQTRVLVPIRPRTLRKGIEARFWLGVVVKEHEACGLDLLDFEIKFDEDVRPPVSYEGVSGGALWRIKLASDLRSLVDTRIIGVAFYQSASDGGHRLITCHGPRSIYGSLFSKIRHELRSAH